MIVVKEVKKNRIDNDKGIIYALLGFFEHSNNKEYRRGILI